MLLSYCIRVLTAKCSTHSEEYVAQLHLDLCQSVVKKKKEKKTCLCHFLFAWSTQTTIYDETKQVKMLHLAINMLVVWKQLDFIWSRQDVVIKGNRVALSILQGWVKDCTCFRNKAGTKTGQKKSCIFYLFILFLFFLRRGVDILCVYLLDWLRIFSNVVFNNTSGQR